MSDLTPTTELAILLTARWAVDGSKPLSNGEFAEVRRWIGPGQEGAQSLLNGVLDLSTAPVDGARLHGLLSRGLGVFQAVDRWMQAGIWVASWADPGYPERFKQLKQRAPVLLFGYGNPNAFSGRALAIVGSRNAGEDRLNMAAEVGRACSARGITVVSGGARGVDTCAMSAGIVGSGTAVGVLADSLLRESGKKLYRDAILEGRLCLMSEVNPEARFDVGNAMARNRLAYACADASLVVECEPNKGGTWAGALDALKEGKAVYVLRGSRAEGHLVDRGAILIDMPFALEPEQLIVGQRPETPIPTTVLTAEIVRRFVGDPIRPREEIAALLRNDIDGFVTQLIDAAVTDGYAKPAAATEHALSTSALRKQQRKRSPKPKTSTLFDAVSEDV